MHSYSAGEIAELVNGRIIGDASRQVAEVSTDSREAQQGKLFVALKGENFDGNDFVAAAVQQGAAVVLVSREIDGISQATQIVVADPLTALTTLATYHRGRFTQKVAAITGSAGKTTTRALLSAILRVAHSVHEPEKNFNNHIGVPLTVMKLHNGFDKAVFELGCSDFNEIGPLTRIVNPDVAVITNVGSAHLEKLRSLEGVAKAKGELFAELRQDACAIINIDDPYINKMTSRASSQITFSTQTEADVRLLKRVPGRLNQILTLQVYAETFDVSFNLPGIYNAVDATAAAAAAIAMGAATEHIRCGLAHVVARPGRFHVREKDGYSVIDDTYNANPSSMAASLLVLGEMVAAPHRMMVLGDMLELGEGAETAHRRLGEQAAKLQPKALFVYGAFAQTVAKSAIHSGLAPESVFSGLNYEEIAKKTAEISESGDALLIKGSRGMKLEKVVNAILEG